MIFRYRRAVIRTFLAFGAFIELCLDVTKCLIGITDGVSDASVK
jgi:hypothetical protein